MKIYIAASCFTIADRTFLHLFTERLRNRFPHRVFFLPQEFVDEELAQYKSSLDTKARSKHVAGSCYGKIQRCDVLLAFVDGLEVDSGVVAEIQEASRLGKHILLIRTDIRSSYINEMLSSYTLLEYNILKNTSDVPLSFDPLIQGIEYWMETGVSPNLRINL